MSLAAKLTAVAVVVVLGLVAVWLLRRGVADLPPPSRSLAEAQNGWPLLQQACEQCLPYEVDWRSIGLPDQAAEEALARNVEAVALLEQAMARPDLEFPLPRESGPALPGIERLRDLNRLLCYRGMMRVVQGDAQTGLDDLVLALRFGRRIEEAGGAVLVWMVGVACESVALGSMEKVLGATPVDDAWAEVVTALEEPHDRQIGIGRCLSAELHGFELAVDAMMAEASGQTGGNGVSGVPATAAEREAMLEQQRRRYAQIARDLAMRPDQRPAPPPAPEVQAGQPSFDFAEQTAVSYATVYRTLRLTDTANAQLAGTAGLIAMLRYRRATGGLPAKWQDLVDGGYLARLPLDPFDGQPLRYDPARGVIWSIGDDLVDQGGRLDQPTRNAPDMVWTIPPAN